MSDYFPSGHRQRGRVRLSGDSHFDGLFEEARHPSGLGPMRGSRSVVTQRGTSRSRRAGEGDPGHQSHLSQRHLHREESSLEYSSRHTTAISGSTSRWPAESDSARHSIESNVVIHQHQSYSDQFDADYPTAHATVGSSSSHRSANIIVDEPSECGFSRSDDVLGNIGVHNWRSGPPNPAGTPLFGSPLLQARRRENQRPADLQEHDLIERLERLEQDGRPGRPERRIRHDHRVRLDAAPAPRRQQPRGQQQRLPYEEPQAPPRGECEPLPRLPRKEREPPAREERRPLPRQERQPPAREERQPIPREDRLQTPHEGYRRVDPHETFRLDHHERRAHRHSRREYVRSEEDDESEHVSSSRRRSRR